MRYLKFILLSAVLSLSATYANVEVSKLSIGAELFSMCNTGVKFNMNSIECKNLQLSFEAGQITKEQAISQLNSKLRVGQKVTVEQLDKKSLEFQKLTNSVIAKVTGNKPDIPKEKSTVVSSDVVKVKPVEAKVVVEPKPVVTKTKVSVETSNKPNKFTTSAEIFAICNNRIRFSLDSIECANIQKKFEEDRLSKTQAISTINKSLKNGSPITIEELDKRSVAAQKLNDSVISSVIESRKENFAQVLKAQEAALTKEQKASLSEDFKKKCYASGAKHTECDQLVKSGNAHKFVALSSDQIAQTLGVSKANTDITSETGKVTVTSSDNIIAGNGDTKLEGSENHDFLGNANGVPDKIPTLDELNCAEAVKLKLESNAKECVDRISANVMDKAEFERDLALKKIEHHYDELLPLEINKCNQKSSRSERKDCIAQVKDKAKKSKKSEIKDAETNFAIKETKYDAIQAQYNRKFDKYLHNKCGMRPFGQKNDSFEKNSYRRCKAEAKKSFALDNNDEMNSSLETVTSNELELDLVKDKCEKGMFNFLSGSYEDCILEQAKAAKEIIANEEAEKARIVAAIEAAQEEKEQAKQAHLDAISKCDQDVRKEINKLLSEDTSNIIGKQFYLTSLKLSKEVLKAKGANKKIATLEDYIKSQNKELDSSGASPEVRKKILGIYQKHGKVGDANTISEQFSSYKSSVYYSRANRLNNENISAYILADTINNKDSSLTELDAASAWLAESIRSQSGLSDGSAADNLMNLSVQAYRNINLLYENDDKAKSEIDRKIAKSKADLEESIGNIKASVEKKFAEVCGPSYFESDCWSQDSFNEKLVSSFTSISKDITKIEMKKGLKGSINGGFKFNFLPRELMK